MVRKHKERKTSVATKTQTKTTVKKESQDSPSAPSPQWSHDNKNGTSGKKLEERMEMSSDEK